MGAAEKHIFVAPKLTPYRFEGTEALRHPKAQFFRSLLRFALKGRRYGTLFLDIGNGKGKTTRGTEKIDWRRICLGFYSASAHAGC